MLFMLFIGHHLKSVLEGCPIQFVLDVWSGLSSLREVAPDAQVDRHNIVMAIITITLYCTWVEGEMLLTVGGLNSQSWILLKGL